MAKKTTSNTGKRYSETEKEKIIAYMNKFDHGGMSRAQEKFNVSYLTLRSWIQPKGKDSKNVGRPAKAPKMEKKMGRPAKVTEGQEEILSTALAELKAQFARLGERLAKLEIPKKAPVETAPATVVETVTISPPVQAPIEATETPASTPIPAPIEAPQVSVGKSSAKSKKILNTVPVVVTVVPEVPEAVTAPAAVPA